MYSVFVSVFMYTLNEREKTGERSVGIERRGFISWILLARACTMYTGMREKEKERKW